MKKNVMMRVASIMLVLVLMSSSVISGTFAKYVTADTGADNARVAKFGVTVTHSDDMFYNAYKDAFTSYVAGETLDTITVQTSVEDEDIIAPGTWGNLAAFDVEGTPEVDVAVSYTADLVFSNNWMVDTSDPLDGVDSEYCPLVFTVNTKEYYIGLTGIESIADLEKAVEDAIVDAAKTYHTNTNLKDVDNDLSVKWEWCFEGSAEHPGVGKGPACQWDKFDTQLGDAAAKGNAATIELTVTCTVTQID